MGTKSNRSQNHDNYQADPEQANMKDSDSDDKIVILPDNKVDSSKGLTTVNASDKSSSSKVGSKK